MQNAAVQVGTIHRVLHEVPISVNIFFFPKQCWSVSVISLLSGVLLVTREAVLKCPFAVCDCLNGQV